MLFSGDNGENVGEIYPDFIGKDPERRLIADAKYKPLDNIDIRDYQQVLAYMFRFDAKTGYYLYPYAPHAKKGPAAKGPCEKLWMNRGSTFDEEEVAPRDDVCVIKHGLKIPESAASYADFAKQMEDKEQEFRDFLKPFNGS